ncbi:MAG: IS1182 family transposase [Desulfobacterales bacterium]|nr:IS1182 family transposase [Desulfobacterales bacterium]
MIKFKNGQPRNQIILFPKSIEEYIPDGHLARLVLSIVLMLNFDKINNKFSNIGQHAFSPKILVAILFYGYAIGIRSSRKLSKACQERLDFMYIAAELRPSHKTISEFRRENLEELKDFFQEIIIIAMKLGLVKIGNINVSIDGTKIRANASGKLSKDESGLEKLLSEVNGKITEILKEAEEIDKKEDFEHGNNRGDELPKELHKLECRKIKIENAIIELKEEKEQLRGDIKKTKSKNGNEGKLNKTEKKKIEKTKINLTDPDAKYMKEREGCVKTNYNAQASVNEDNQFILANDVTDECNDKKQLIPMLEKTEKNVGGKVNKGKADSGYHSANVLAAMSNKDIDLYVDDPSKQRLGSENFKYDKVNFKYNSETDSYTCPEGNKLELRSRNEERSIYICKTCNSCSMKKKCTKGENRTITRNKNEHLVEENRKKLLSEDGKEEYQKRMHTVEPVFGNIKENTGFRRFLLRGLEKVKGEFNIACIAHNLKKIAAYCVEDNIDLERCLA